MNPFARVWCYNADADENTEMIMPRWRLWWEQRFGNQYSRCWREVMTEPDAGTWEQVKRQLGIDGPTTDGR